MSAVRHHFVPQGYLRGFSAADKASKNFVWVYDKREGRRPAKKSVASIAWAKAYYAQENADGSVDLDTMETQLAQTIDNQIPDLLRKIVPRAGRKFDMSEEDRGALAFFVGLSITRVPSFRDGINDVYSWAAQAALNAVIEKRGYPEGLSEEHELKAVAKPWVSLKPMVEIANAIAGAALTKDWQFYLPPAAVPLLTSDNPVVFSGGAAGLSHLGPAHPQAELLINLRKDLALVCTPKRGYANMTFDLSPADARKFNRGVVSAARQRVFADHHSDKLDEFVKKYFGLEQRVVV